MFANLVVPPVFEQHGGGGPVACCWMKWPPSHESDDIGTSRVVVRQSVPKATSSGGGPECVTDSLSGIMPTGPIASTSAMDDGNSANNGGAGVGSDTQTLSSLQASVKLLSDQMAWFVDKLKEPEAELS